MIRYTNLPRTTEQEVLALDSIYRILSADERILLHQSQTRSDELTDKIRKLMQWIESSGWKTPYMKYPEFHNDALYYEDENGELQPVENYPKAHPKITEQLKNL